MEYTLKDKIKVTKSFLEDLVTKSWQEIENLQNQIANIEADSQGGEVMQLLNKLVTSYYVFVGGLENLADGPSTTPTKELIINSEPISKEPVPPVIEVETETEEVFEPVASTTKEAIDDIEPFEYFVDFDDPTGDPITDDDLYN